MLIVAFLNNFGKERSSISSFSSKEKLQILSHSETFICKYPEFAQGLIFLLSGNWLDIVQTILIYQQKNSQQVSLSIEWKVVRMLSYFALHVLFQTARKAPC